MKNIRNFNRRKQIVKTFILFSFIQLLIVVILAFTLVQRQQITREKTETVTFVPEKVEAVELISLSLHAQKNRDIYVYYNSIKYKVAVEYFRQYNTNELLNLLPKEKLTIVYEKTTRNIVDIRSENSVYYTMADYNKEQFMQKVLGIIFILIAEFVLIIIFVLYFLIFLKSNRRRNKR